jgi:hypothetical protein
MFMLSKNEIDQFILKGFVRVDDAFSPDTAKAVRNILWTDLSGDRSDPSTWAEPVIRLGRYSQGPFVESLNTPVLKEAFDQLVGEGRWLPCRSVGTFPVRFPCAKPPQDTGKHVDAGFPGSDPNNYFEWRVNIQSKGRGLLMLALYSDVGEDDAPTVIYEGSHLDVARLLVKEGDAGLSFMELAGRLEGLPKRKALTAIGKGGTVYLCHPFLVHSAQAHRGSVPKFMAQPPLLLKEEFSLSGTEGKNPPVVQAIRLALGS